MRILRYMVTTTLLLVIGACLFFLIGREVVLSLATSQIRDAIATLRKERDTGGYVTQCQTKGSVFIEGQELAIYQVRFVSPESYVIEVICDQFSFDPIEISKDTLPPYVSKQKGSSGILLSQNGSGVKVETFARLADQIEEMTGIDTSFMVRESGVYVFDNKTYYTETDTALVSGPKTTCSGYGYSCCSTISHVGAGDQFLGSSDCDKTCFSQCVDRPLLLSFETNPFVNLSTKMLEIQSGTLVDFAYVASHVDDRDLLTVISFGDGNSQTLVGTSGQTSHTYTCTTQQCRFTASVTVTDDLGIVSVASEVSSIPIVVTR